MGKLLCFHLYLSLHNYVACQHNFAEYRCLIYVYSRQMSIKYTYISNTKHNISLPYYFKYSFLRKFDCSNVELGHKVNLHLSFSGCLTEISIRKSITIPTNMLSDCFKFCDGQTIGIKV